MPVITISRGTFSGGQELAECLAGHLGYPCVSREVLVEAASLYGASEAQLSAALDHAPTLMDRLRRDREHYLVFIRAVLCKYAQAGSFVYHGHGGHHLLAGVRHVLRVRVVADSAYRVAAAAKRLNMTSRQAEAHIKSVDEERRKWTRFLYGVEWEDPANYDVVLNLEYLGIEGTCAAVARLAELPQFQPTPESTAALANLALRSFVEAALAKDPRTRDADVRVRADDGSVTLEGAVRRREAAASAREVAASVAGVREVIDHVVSADLLV